MVLQSVTESALGVLLMAESFDCEPLTFDKVHGKSAF